MGKALADWLSAFVLATNFKSAYRERNVCSLFLCRQLRQNHHYHKTKTLGKSGAGKGFGQEK